MARKIRFGLNMPGKQNIRTMEELKQNFDFKTVLEYYFNGKLTDWLNDRGYKEYAEQVATLDSEKDDFEESLCKIFGAEYTAAATAEDVEALVDRKEEIRKYTDDVEILENAGSVVLTQKELNVLVNGDEKQTVYLIGKEFKLNGQFRNKTYIGLNNPQVKFINLPEQDLEKASIKIDGVSICDENIKQKILKKKDKVSKKRKYIFFKIFNQLGMAMRAGGCVTKFEMAINDKLIELASRNDEILHKANLLSMDLLFDSELEHAEDIEEKKVRIYEILFSKNDDINIMEMALDFYNYANGTEILLDDINLKNNWNNDDKKVYLDNEIKVDENDMAYQIARNIILNIQKDIESYPNNDTREILWKIFAKPHLKGSYANKYKKINDFVNNIWSKTFKYLISESSDIEIISKALDYCDKGMYVETI